MEKSLSKKIIILSIAAAVLFAGIYYYLALPAINIHATGFWTFILFLLVIVAGIYVLRRRFKYQDTVEDLKKNKIVRYGVVLIILVILVFIIGSILSSPIVNAKQYRELITVEERSFSEDIKQVDYSKIPLLDKDSARLLGNRKMGSMVDMVSQFEVSNLYSQINYNGKPVRVTPLVYASPIKWLTNREGGIPAYIMIDMTTQDTELIKLDQSIRYSESEYFNRNIYRHMRFQYPTYIFDQFSFEIDDDGTPYWICPVKDFTIGLFGGETIGRVVICNAVTGETTDYSIEECPQWVDKAYPAEMLLEHYDYYGTLVNGYLNSILSQRGCLQTTDGYNYIALDDDVWVYTGITSVSGDESNVGFVLMNQRTHDVYYYEINGAEEYSAMDSAEGQVQHLGYMATFPLLINVANEPTYFMALKDYAGLVKMYAMVNIQKYQNVAIGSTVAECEKAYRDMLADNGISTGPSADAKEITGAIKKIVDTVIDGNSHYYILLANSNMIFDVVVAENIDVIRYEVGDKVTMSYYSGDEYAEVIELK